MVTVESFRTYLNPTPDITDAQLELWLNAAKSEARTAGVPDYKHNAHYDLFIYSLGSWYYDNRGMQVSGTYQATALETKKKITDTFVLELRYAGEDESPSDDQSDASLPDAEPSAGGSPPDDPPAGENDDGGDEP